MSEPGVSLIETEGLVVGYGSIAVARDLNLTIRSGEIVALLGANGVGKTTTLMTIAGLLKPLGGHIRVFGTPSGGRRTEQLVHDGLALIPEDRALFRGLTVDQHLRLTGRSGRPAREHVFTIFPALGAIRGRPARLLSGGEQQMLAIARALVTLPRVLLIDELSLGLAPPVVSELLSALRNLADSEGLAILLVEQQVDRALAVADRAHLMASGRLSESKDASALLLDRTAVENSYLGTLAAGGSPPLAGDADREAKST